MKQFIHNRLIFIVGGLFLFVLTGTVIFAGRFGEVLGGRFNRVEQPRLDQVITTREKRTIRKITIDKEDNTGCIEVTPDGVIRVFAICDGEATNAARPQDYRAIQELFKTVSETNFVQYGQKRKNSIKVIIETDQGTQTVYLPLDILNGNQQGTAAQIQQIITIIDTIIKEITQPTPTTTIVPSPSPSLPPGVTATPSPLNSSGIPTATPLLTPTPTGPPKDPFTCIFQDSSGTKPYRVSGVVCSSEPQPAAE